MSERHDAIDRLRAADPARGVEPDLAALRARVDAGRTAAQVDAPHDPSRAGSTGGTVVDLAERRRRRGLRLGAAAAGVALLAGAFGLGRTFGVPEAGTPSAAPAISLDRTQPEAASSGPASLDASTAIYPAPSSRHTTFRSQGLSDDGGSAVAWAYDATARFGPDQVRELGAAVGLSGEPRQEFGAWVLGPQDGTGPSLSVAPDGMTSVSFYDPTKEPFRCAAVGGGTEPGAVTEPAPAIEPGATEPGATGEDAATSDMVEPLPAESCGPVDLGPAPTGEAARAQAADVLTAAGLDPASFELVDTALGDTTMTEVLAHHVVDGRRTGASWYIMLTGAGVQSFSGPVAPLVELGDYPVIGAASAVERLTDPRFSDLGTLSIMRDDVDPAAAEGGADDTVTSEVAPDAAFPTEPPAPVTAGQPVPWPVEEVAITGATLGVAQYTTPSGAAMLLPAYALTSEDGRTWSVLAVAEGSLDLAS
ncbi:hypothetical protein [Georgenia muralis]|uniref:Uncharacterized protein n=1 Tax=Georgenia muralis TaxID=154117 RepID=A0A3N4Z491_9MICO|nr:hypothetical protein [Georgenia muralis]RPF26684.1 hypothetical protein EDD32_1132 [Georgenia muralis]